MRLKLQQKIVAIKELLKNSKLLYKNVGDFLNSVFRFSNTGCESPSSLDINIIIK